MWTLLKHCRKFSTVLYRTINFNRQPLFSYFLLVNKLYNLNVFKLRKTYFRHVQKFKRYLYLRPFNAFSYTKSSILNIKYIFSFSWSLDCTSLVCMQVIHLNSVHLRFLGSVDIGAFLYLQFLKDKI